MVEQSNKLIREILDSTGRWGCSKDEFREKIEIVFAYLNHFLFVIADLR